MFLSSLLADSWADAAIDGISNFALWLTVALVALALILGIIICLKDKTKIAPFLKIALAALVGYLIVFASIFFYLYVQKIIIEESLIPILFYPMCVLGGSIVLGGIASAVCAIYSDKAFKLCLKIAGGTVLAAFIAVIVCLVVYFKNDISGSEYYDVKNVPLYLSMAGLLVALAAATFFFGRKDKSPLDTKAISYAAVCISMSFVLSYMKLFSLPQGGSVTLASLLPLMIYAYMFGVKKGIFAGFIYGILQAVQDPYIIHPAQFLLDYPIAFAFIGAAGLFRSVKALAKRPPLCFALGAAVSSVFRFASHLLSGVFAFGAIDSSLSEVWIYSLGYNSFVFADIAIAIAAGIFVFMSKSFLRQIDKYAPTETQTQSNAEESKSENP